MVLPLLFGLAGSALGGAGALGSLGALGAGAIGSGLGRFAETGDLGKGIETGLTSFLGGQALSSIGKMANIESLAKAGELGTKVPDFQVVDPAITGLGTLTNPAVAGQALIGQATVPPPPMELPEQVEFENRQAGIPDAISRRPPPGYRPGYDAEFDYGVSPNYGVGLMSQDNPRYMNMGGIIDLIDKKKFQEGGMAESDDMAHQIIEDAVNAIKGLSDAPEIALGRFVSKYGKEALEDLVERVEEGEFDEEDTNMVRGEGDGMDDVIPATIEGQQDVLLSDNEFVVPADVVSGLGNGSSDAGARELEKMMARVRQLRTGKTEQPQQVPQELMLPA